MKSLFIFNLIDINTVNLSKQTSKALFETIFELIKKALESGDDFLLSRFGKVSVR
jgi:nucleoid DNA-binding protein